MGQMDSATLLAAIGKEQHPKVRAAAIRLTEPALKSADQATFLPALIALANTKDAEVLTQLAFTLGEAKTPAAETAMANIVRNAGTNGLVRDALISGLAVREVEMLERVFADQSWADKTKVPGGEGFIGALAKSVFQQARGDRVNPLLAAITRAETPKWQTLAVLASLNVNPPATKKGEPPPRVKFVKLAAEPPALASLAKSDDKAIQAAAQKLDKVLVWPGKPGVNLPVIRPLTEPEQVRFTTGKTMFEATCAACHQPHGYGQDGLAPPLVDSEWVAGSPERLARIILHGVGGPITVLGKKWDMDMPGHGTFDDETVAAVMTYLRRAFDHDYDPVAPDFVKKVRAATAGRESAWTDAELKKLK
jgi:mono/diheme cytochrome c family protein